MAKMTELYQQLRANPLASLLVRELAPIFGEIEYYLKVSKEECEEILIEIIDDSLVEKLKEEPLSASDINKDSIKKENPPEDSEYKYISAKRKRKNEKTHPCPVCGDEYKNLARHLDQSHGPYNCIDCLISFPSKNLLSEHISTAHNQDPNTFTCDICDTGFTSVINLAVHTYKHTKKYSCPLCEYSAKGSNKYSLVNHLRRHQAEYSDYCELCGKGFFNKHALLGHMEIHEAIPKYECEICKKKFCVKRYLDVHKSSNHKKELFGIEEIFQCEICGRRFTFEKSLVRHLSAIHKVGEDRTVECPVCKKIIANNHNLKKHMRVHTGEKRFCCESCGKAFAERKYWKKHQLFHERETERKRTIMEAVHEEYILPDDPGTGLHKYFKFEESDEDSIPYMI